MNEERKKVLREKLVTKRADLQLYREMQAKMLKGGTQSYGIGSRSASKYQMSLSEIRKTIKEHEEEISDIEKVLGGGKPLKTFSIIPCDI